MSSHFKENVGPTEKLLGADNDIEFLKHFLWISYWKIKVQRPNMPHFKAFDMMNMQYEIRIW